LDAHHLSERGLGPRRAAPDQRRGQAEIDYTAFTSRRKADHIQGRLIVRRVKRLKPNTKTPAGTGDAGQQQELFTAYPRGSWTPAPRPPRSPPALTGRSP